MFIDSDDYLLPNSLKAFSDEIISNPDIDIVVGSTIVGNKTDIKKRELLNGRESLIKGFLTMKYMITSWNKLVRRECITANNLYFIDDIYAQDQPWLYSLVSLIDSMLLIPNATYFYEEASESTSHGVLNPEKAQRYVKSWNTIFDYYLSHRPNSKSFKQNLEVDYLLYLQHTHLRSLMLYPYEKKEYNQILKIKNKIMLRALKDVRLIIACFLLLEYKPFIYIFKFKCIRTHYFYLKKMVGRIAHLFDFVHRKN
jgi:glycosyltransferase involved in cell wall biosynthesis